MNLPRAAVSRPVFTTMVTLIVLTLGVVSLIRLQIDLLPDIEMPTLTVQTGYEGASPEVIERLVTQIVEEIIGTVPGVEEMVSTSAEGSSRVRVTFGWGTDLDIAAQDVRMALEDEIGELPEDISRLRISKFDIATVPVVIVGIGSSLDPVEMTELVDRQVRPRLAQVAGVAQADLWGGFYREVRIELLPERLRAFGLPLNAVLEAIRAANVDLPAGSIEDGNYEVTLRAPEEFRTLADVRATVVDVRDGAAVRLDQVADIRDTYERLRRIVRVNGEDGLRIGIRKQGDANTVEVSQNILAEIEAINADYPQLNVVVVRSQGNFIERSIRNVARSVLYGGGLAVLVLLLFLRSFGSTLTIGLSIPISVVATFTLIYGGGFTLNLMTLGGLALGVGMMVDSSIVVLENIRRRQDEAGEEPGRAAVSGAAEVATAIVASTITTMVIFLPLAFVRGVSGELFRELAYVIVFALVCALLVSLSVTPMLAAWLLRRRPEESRIVPPAVTPREAEPAAEDGSLGSAYRSLLGAALRHRVVTLLLAFGLLGGSLLLLPWIGTDFMPPSDEGEVRLVGEMEVGSRLELVDRQTQVMESMALEVLGDDASAWVTNVGGGGGNPGAAAQGNMRITLRPVRERSRSNTEVAEDLREAVEGRVPGMTIRTRAPQGQFLLERVLRTAEGITVEVRGPDLGVLEALSRQVEEVLGEVAGVTDVRVNQDPGQPQRRVRVDRRKAADLGLTVRDVTEAIETAIAGRRAGEFRAAGESYRILVQLKDAPRLSIEQLLDMTLRTPRGEDVALRNVVRTEPGRGPTVIERKDQRRTVEVNANVTGRDLGSTAAEVDRSLRGVSLPTGYTLTVTGAYEEQRKSKRELTVSLALAIALVYMVLACQYESLRDPLIVMLSVPMAAVGVLTTLWATGTTLNVQSYIGCIMLGGIVVNNAILLVDQAGRLSRSGMDPDRAVIEAGRRRLRPILMTTLTTILGLAPLALGVGEGADAQAPLARAVIGGLAASTLITLVLIPVTYTLVHGRGHSRAAEPPATRIAP
ncbi:MAG: efflux RND transporter permease subunit [Planctomycetota bacterium]